MSDSVNPLPDTKYSLNWARGVIFAYKKSSPRVTFFFNEVLGLSDEQMAKVLAKRPVEWRYLKASCSQYIKWAEKQRSLFPEQRGDNVNSVKEALLFVHRSKSCVQSTEKLDSYIDRQIKLAIE